MDGRQPSYLTLLQETLQHAADDFATSMFSWAEYGRLEIEGR